MTEDELNDLVRPELDKMEITSTPDAENVEIFVSPEVFNHAAQYRHIFRDGSNRILLFPLRADPNLRGRSCVARRKKI